MVAVVLPATLAVYSRAIEPYWIEVTRHTIVAPAGAHLGAAVKIAHLTDLHSRGLERRERRLLALLEEEKPDAIVFTGDMLNPENNFQRVTDMLSHMRAPLGKWMVRGNWENWMHPEHLRGIYRIAGVNLLFNQAAELRPGLWLVGLDDAIGVPNLETALAEISPEAGKAAFTIALFHSPAYFTTVAGRVRLALAGHTHGGQVRLPIIAQLWGPLWLPPNAGGFVHGWYQHGGSRLYVSRGIGTSILPVRFLCRPEVAFITIAPPLAPAAQGPGETRRASPPPGG